MDCIQEKLDRAQRFIPTFYYIKLMKVGSPEEFDNEFEKGHFVLSEGDSKLEGIKGEHWSMPWEQIAKKFILFTGHKISP